MGNKGTPRRRAYSAASPSGGPSVLMPSVNNTMPAGVVPRRSSNTARTPSPSRVDWPVGTAERISAMMPGTSGCRQGRMPVRK